jgi:hypothetical protein
MDITDAPNDPDTNPPAHTPTASGTPAAPPRPRARPALTYAILAGGLLTTLGALAAHGRSRPSPRPPADAVADADKGAAAVAAAPLHPQLPPPAVADAPPPQVPANAGRRPRVELVFALDTTGSMGGLIEGAKQKIWSLASFVAQGQPTPDLRVGLIAYRDIGDEYVTRVFDLDGDLDRVSRRLRGFVAAGGGDGPEHVARALDESVHKISWSAAPEVVKVIYLVGDAPAHTDYQDGYDYQRAARAAARQGIQLHTILCGGDPAAAEMWRRIASLGRGEFMAINQDGGVRAEHSRYDDELAALHDRLAGTTIAYGASGAAALAENRAALAAPSAIKAARASYMARNAKAVGGEGDLVESIARGRVRLDDVQADLPAEMQAMDRAAQAAHVAAKQKERDAINQRIDELGKLRRAELDARERDAARAGVSDGFDVAAKKALRKSVADNALAGLAL